MIKQRKFLEAASIFLPSAHSFLRKILAYLLTLGQLSSIAAVCQLQLYALCESCLLSPVSFCGLSLNGFAIYCKNLLYTRITSLLPLPSIWSCIGRSTPFSIAHGNFLWAHYHHILDCYSVPSSWLDIMCGVTYLGVQAVLYNVIPYLNSTIAAHFFYKNQL